MTLKMQAAGSSETSALVSPPCVTVGNFTAPTHSVKRDEGQASSSINDPISGQL